MKRFIQQSAARRKNRVYPSRMHQDKLLCLWELQWLVFLVSRQILVEKKKKKNLPSNQFGHGLIIQKVYVQPGFCAVVWSVLYLARVKHERHCVPSSWHRLNTHTCSLALLRAAHSQTVCSSESQLSVRSELGPLFSPPQPSSGALITPWDSRPGRQAHRRSLPWPALTWRPLPSAGVNSNQVPFSYLLFYAETKLHDLSLKNTHAVKRNGSGGGCFCSTPVHLYQLCQQQQWGVRWRSS